MKVNTILLDYDGTIDLVRMSYSNLDEEQKAKAESEFFAMFRELTKEGVLETVWNSMTREEHLEFITSVLPQCGFEIGQKAKEKISETGRSIAEDLQTILNHQGGTENE